MDRYSDVVQNENGRAVPGASILIVGANGQPATIFSDRQGTPLANPFTSDTLGRWSFCAADGIYSARVSFGGVLKATVPDIRLEDPDDGFASLASTNGAGLIGMLDGRSVQVAHDALSTTVAGLSNYSLPIASNTTLGGVKVGSGLAIDSSGNLTATGLVAGSVSSVNGQAPNSSGAVTLSTDDLAEDSAPVNLWFTGQRVRDVALTGLSVATNAVIAATDTVLSAAGKLQAQVSAIVAALAGKQDVSGKGAVNGYAGLDANRSLVLPNPAGTFNTTITNAATAARSIALPNKAGTVALLDDIPASNSAMILLGSATVSTAVANIDFLSLFTSAYDKYIIEVQGILPSTSTTLLMRLAKTGAADAASVYSGPSTRVSVSVSSMSTTIASSYTISVRNANDAVRRKGIGVHGLTYSTSNDTVLTESAYDSANIVTGFQLYPNTGNIIAGTVRVYGVKNS